MLGDVCLVRDKAQQFGSRHYFMKAVIPVDLAIAAERNGFKIVGVSQEDNTYRLRRMK